MKPGKKITIPNIDASRVSDSERGRSASIYIYRY